MFSWLLRKRVAEVHISGINDGFAPFSSAGRPSRDGRLLPVTIFTSLDPKATVVTVRFQALKMSAIINVYHPWSFSRYNHSSSMSRPRNSVLLRSWWSRRSRRSLSAAAITHRAEGYFIVHVDSGKENDYPWVNGVLIDPQARRLNDSDVVQLAGVKMGFFEPNQAADRAVRWQTGTPLHGVPLDDVICGGRREFSQQRQVELADDGLHQHECGRGEHHDEADPLRKLHP
jgi:hypothetical protein